MTTARRLFIRSVALLLFGMVFFATPALAHQGHAADGFGHGLLHPFAGLDHLLAMIAVGLLAARLSGRKRWLLPTSFVGFMLAGGVLGLIGFELATFTVEWGIAASVLVFGLMVFGLPRVPLLASMLVIGAFAIFHGYAHVVEMEAASVAAYFSGMTIGTALLHGSGLAAGLMLARLDNGEVRYVRAAGAVLTLAFLVVLGVG